MRRKGIEWNRVTWYSKLLAVLVFLGILALTFYFGMAYQAGYEAKRDKRFRLNTVFNPISYSEIETECAADADSCVLEAPALSYHSGPSRSVRITFDTTLAPKFNIYRSAATGWKKILSDVPHDTRLMVDYDLPEGATTLWYRYMAVDENGKESKPSPTGTVNLQ